jgi:hypothetical protein
MSNEDWELKYYRLRSSVVSLYYGAYWSSDRLTQNEEKKIFDRLKNLCGFEEDGPVPIINIDINVKLALINFVSKILHGEKPHRDWLTKAMENYINKLPIDYENRYTK